MAEETKATKTAPEVPCAAEEVVVVSDVPVAEKPASEKEVPPQPEPEKAEKEVAVEGGDEKEKEKEGGDDEKKKVTESASFKEESNKVDDLVDREKKALDEFKQMIQDALAKREFYAPPPPPKEEEKPKEEEPKPAEEIKEEAKPDEKKEEIHEPPKAEEKKEEEPKTEEKPAEQPCEEPVKEEEEKKAEEKETVVEKIEVKVEAAVEEIKETIVHEVTPPAPSPCEEPAAAPAAEEEKPKEEETAAPEEVSIWGVKLLADEKTDVVLLKFLRARDFKVKDAFAMLKSVVAWRKEFGIEELLEEDVAIDGLDKVVYAHGVDKEGHPVCYNAFGEFQDKELYGNTFADAEKRDKFLKYYIKFLEKNVRELDFSPDGMCTIVQVTDLKNSPGLILFKKELRQATNRALQLLQDNYPEFVAKQVFINVPWWYVAYNRMISPFLTQRTKSKFVFASPTRTTETLFKYIAPEQVPVQYGGLSKAGEHDFTTGDPAIEETIKPACKHIIELPITEACTLVWEVRVLGWDVTYGAEFVPSDEGAYTWIVQKPRKIGSNDEQVVCYNFKIGETGKVLLTFDNQTSKKKKLLYRSKTKA